MSLATRCASCGTVFRVVQDQLKVSAGWVRCGRCNEAFNALEDLFDLEADPLPGAAPPSLAAPAAAAAAPAEAGRIDPVFDAPAAGPVHADAALGTPIAAHGDADAANAAPEVGVPTEADRAGEAEAAAPSAPLEFLRQAERAQRPRILLTLSCALLALTLAAQAAFEFRDLLAATLPPLRPRLVALCDAVGCRIEPPRRIDDIVVESSALTAAPGGAAVRLTVVLRNRGALTLAMPSIELALTDAGGQLIARRALAPADFGVADRTLASAAEANLQLVLATGAQRAGGYTVEPFYP